MQSLKKLTFAALALLLKVEAVKTHPTPADEQPASFSLEMDQHYTETHKYSHMVDSSLNKRSSEESQDLVTRLLQIASGERKATLEFEA